MQRTIGIIAPAGKIDEEKLKQSISFFQTLGIKTKVMPHVVGYLSDERYLSSSVDNRLKDLYLAWEDNEIDYILAARGGYGCMQLLDKIDWERLKKHKKIIIGYSDITALHLAMLKKNCGIPMTGVMGLKSPTLFLKEINLKSLQQSLDKTTNNIDLSQYISPIKSGHFSGNIIVANLTMLCSLIGTKYLPTFKNKALLIEDINEPAYKVSRMITQLQLSGVLKDISALIFGEFTDCGNENELDIIFNKLANNLQIPIGKNFPFGHGDNIFSINMKKKYNFKI